MSVINAYLSFNGKCREAMSYYKDCLGGELTFQPVEGTPMEANCPGAMKQHILHSMLQKDSMVLMATDMVGPEGFIKGTNMSLSVSCSSEEELKNYFTTLSKEGKILDPLSERFWGSVFGCLVDKYGVMWMFDYHKNGNSSQ